MIISLKIINVFLKIKEDRSVLVLVMENAVTWTNPFAEDN